MKEIDMFKYLLVICAVLGIFLLELVVIQWALGLFNVHLTLLQVFGLAVLLEFIGSLLFNNNNRKQ